MEIAKPESAESELLLLKLTIHAEVVSRYGTKPSARNSRAQKKHYLVEEKKILRKKKKEAKKESKKLRREGADDEKIRLNKTEWRRLVRLHNKVRVQEIELQNKLDEIKNNNSFAKDPFSFIKREVTKGSTEHLEPDCDVATAEKFFTDRYSDQSRTEKVDFPEFLDLPPQPSHMLPTSAPSKDDFEKYIRSRRNKSRPGPDGIPFVLYKKCQSVRARLIQLLRTLWNDAIIPHYDKQAIKILIAKTLSKDICHFRDITLFNTSLKTLTGVWGRKICDFMTKNHYIDVNIQKGFIPRTSGCIEHNQTLPDILKESKRNKEPFQLAFLDLENAFGSAKHNLILAALKWFNIPKHWISIIQQLYNKCFVIVKTSKWTTTPIHIQKGSLQGGPEAGVLFNIPWNMILSGLLKFLKSLGYTQSSKPLSAFADDATLKTHVIEHMQLTLNEAEKLCKWSKCLKFKESKSATMAIDCHGKPVDPKLRLNGKVIPSLLNKPFKFLGRWVYPSLKDTENVEAATRKLENLLNKTDKLLLDGRKKSWIYQNGILPYLSWDFMMIEFSESVINKMESCVNRRLKKWLKITKSADPSIMYRGSFGLNITNIRNAILTSRTNVEIILCTSKDPTVRQTAKRRRESDYLSSRQNTPKRIKTAVNDLEFQKTFCHITRTNKDKRGIGAEKSTDKVRVNKKSIVKRVKELSEEEKIAKVMSLAMQSNWTKWDELINMDLKWNEVMYGFSPSMLSFWLNSIQNTLPDPSNLRRWGKQKTANCSLCNWKNCTLQHIICSCKTALDQGRISWRHDSILASIVKHIKQNKLKHRTEHKLCEEEEDKQRPVKFIKKGMKPRKRRKRHYCYWGQHDDWKILMDTREHQYQVPPSIASTSQRPDICVYSDKAKKVCFIELTSPAEENINIWKLKKRQKYLDLVEEAKSNGYYACCRTIEVGARGFVSKSSMNVFSMLGVGEREKTVIRKEMSKIAVRCSHFIWINRENPQWSNPSRVFK